MDSQRGSALILALMMLAFLMILGTALLSSVTLDVAIGENYRSETQLLYLAEAGIEEARGLLLELSDSPSQLLQAAAGLDGTLSNSRDLDILLGGTDDIPFLNGGDRSTGRLVVDTSGQPAGRYYVFLRNDAADGMTGLTDSNQVLTLLSVAVIGNARKVLDVTIRKWQFPVLPASLILAGSPVLFTPGSGGGISGIDSTGRGSDKAAIGVWTAEDQLSVLSIIPDGNEFQYPGSGTPRPPPADVAVVDMLMDSRLRTPAGMERIVDRILESATDRFNPGWNGATSLGSMGTSSDYRIVVVNGDCLLGSVTGFGVLLVRGNLEITGSFQWKGLILVIGQGSFSWAGAGSGSVSGHILVARTRADDRTSANELGSMLPAAGPIEVDFDGGGNLIQMENPGAADMGLVNQKFPYEPIAIREF